MKQSTLPPALILWLATNKTHLSLVPVPGNTVVAGYGPTVASSAFYMQPVFVTRGSPSLSHQHALPRPPRPGVQPSRRALQAMDLPPAPYAAPQGTTSVPLAENISLTQQLYGNSGDPIGMNVFILDFYLQLVGLAVQVVLWVCCC